jgi:hypothetical protein
MGRTRAWRCRRCHRGVTDGPIHRCTALAPEPWETPQTTKAARGAPTACAGGSFPVRAEPSPVSSACRVCRVWRALRLTREELAAVLASERAANPHRARTPNAAGLLLGAALFAGGARG